MLTLSFLQVACSCLIVVASIAVSYAIGLHEGRRREQLEPSNWRVEDHR